MTVVGAMYCHGYLLIGCDSAVRETAIIRSLKAKLDKLDTLSVVWGTSGDEFTGDEFGDWLKTCSFEGKDWLALANDATDKLAELNGHRKRTARMAGVRLKDEDLTDALIVGYLDGIPEIVEIDHKGETSLHIRNNRLFSAIGSGSPHARIIFYALCRVPGFQRNLQGMRFVLSVATQLDPKCAAPIHVMEITENGIVDLSGGEMPNEQESETGPETADKGEVSR